MAKWPEGLYKLDGGSCADVYNKGGKIAVRQIPNKIKKKTKKAKAKKLK